MSGDSNSSTGDLEINLGDASSDSTGDEFGFGNQPTTRIYIYLF